MPQTLPQVVLLKYQAEYSECELVQVPMGVFLLELSEILRRQRSRKLNMFELNYGWSTLITNECYAYI